VRGWAAKVLGGIVAAAVALTAAPGAVAVSGRPSSVVLRDGTDDVWRVNLRTSAWTRVGDLPSADVTRAVIRHRVGTVLVRQRFVDIRRVGKQTYWTGFGTSTGDYFTELVSRRGSRAGHLRLLDGPAGDRVPCPGLSHRIDYAHDVVIVRVPRTCMEGPRWVSANIGNILVLGSKPHRRHHADNPHDDQPYVNQGTRRLYREPA
jgi:hypothetical protein